MVDALAVECALLPGDVIYVRDKGTQRASVAQVARVERFPQVRVLVRLMSGWCNWQASPPAWTDCTGAEVWVMPRELEEIQE
jgi:hypothetical protein